MVIFFLKPSLLEENGVSNSCSNSFCCLHQLLQSNRLWTPPSSWWKYLHLFNNVFQIYIYIYHIYLYIHTIFTCFMLHIHIHKTFIYKCIFVYTHIWYFVYWIEIYWTFITSNSLVPQLFWHQRIPRTTKMMRKKCVSFFFLWLWRWGLNFLEISYLPISGRRKITNIPYSIILPRGLKTFFQFAVLKTVRL